MKIINCRNCKKKKLNYLFSLGNISFTGKFPKKNQKIKKAPLDLVMCNQCKLVQLSHKFNLRYLYGPDYGYRSGINSTMVNHLRKVVIQAIKKVKLKKNDMVLDIASNDATLLNFYKKKIIKYGVDPILNKYKKEYKKINYKFPKFFDYKFILKNDPNAKFKIISALSVFYDLENPNIFLNGIRKLLDKDGIFYLE